jgi:hypothetical protein
MRLRRCAAALSAAGLVAILGGASGVVAQAAGGASAGPDLSTLEAAKAYLVSQGFDPSKFIFQVGLKNYAGPSCPGLGWNCTTANLVVQIAAPGGTNWADCAPDAQQCVIVQGTQPVEILGGEGSETNMHGHCPEAEPGKRLMAHESTTLTCTITQNNETPGGNNHAVAGIAIHDNDGPVQEARMDAVVEQFALGDGDNHAVVHEEIVLQTSDESTGTQMQDGFQSLNLIQGTETGDNFADVKQTQRITAHARLPATTQKQNTLEDPDPCAGPSTEANTCVNFRQTTEAGRNDLNVHQDHNVAAVGAGGQQNQGCASKECTLELDGSQEFVGSTNGVDNHQSITYTLRGPAGTTQIQDPRIANGPGFQLGSENDLWKVTQLAVLTANDADDLGDVQAHINQVDDLSVFGTVDAQSVIIIDGERSEIVCNQTSCNYVQACGDVEEFFEDDPEFLCPDFREEPPPVD